MIQSFYTGNAGLNANKKWLSIISDNIANVNTIGFKAETANFEDLIARSLSTYANGSPKNIEIGGGAFVGSTVKDFSQGSFMNTNSPTDLALDGEGFFMVEDNTGMRYYTRAGQFRLDANGDLINLNGMKLQGWMLDENGNIAGAIGAINIKNAIDPHVTSKVAFKEPTNLNVSSPFITEVFDAGDSNTFSYVNNIQVYDSIGKSHNLEYFFVHTGTNQWRVYGLLDDEPIQYTGSDGRTYDALEINFNSNGEVTNIKFVGLDSGEQTSTWTENTDLGEFTNAALTQPILLGSVKISEFNGNPVRWIDDGHGNIIDLENDNRIVGSISYNDGKILINQAAGDGSSGSSLTVSYKTYDDTQSIPGGDYTQIVANAISMNNQDSQTLNTGANPLQITLNIAEIRQLDSDFIFYAEQNGYAKGDLLSVAVSEDGIVRGVYSNGQVRDWAQIAIATFKDKEILVRKGNNLYLPNQQTFTPIIVPGGVISKVRSGFLELSNVDISREFINLITAQRAYQANARTITTSDQVLQETMNMKR